MNTKRGSTLFTILLLLLSMLPSVAPQDVINDQGDKTAILVTDITANDTEEILVQYLGDENARLHWAFFNDACLETANQIEDVTPLEVVNITIPVSEEDEDRKVLIFVEDTAGNNLIDQPLLGTKYVNGRIAMANLPAVTAPATNQSDEIASPGAIRFNGNEYGNLAEDFDYLPFLLSTNNFTNNITNQLFINTFNLTSNVNATQYNDEEQQSSQPFLGAVCNSLFNFNEEGITLGGIGGSGITQGVPNAGASNAGVGVIASAQSNGALFGQAALVDRNPNNVGESTALANLFFREQGDNASLGFIPLNAEPQGLFTNDNENYQNPYQSSAVSSIGFQKPVFEDFTTAFNESRYNRDTIFAVYNNGAARQLKARYDFIDQDGTSTTCQHQDLNITLTANDVEYFRASQFTGDHLVSGDAAVAGVLTVWDPSNGDTLIGYRWDVIMETQPQCNDNIDNDGDGDIDYPDDFECDSPLDDDEATAGAQARVDEISSVDTMEQMLTLDATVDSNNQATFEAAEHFTTLVPTIDEDPLALTTPDYNIVVVNWDSLDDDSAASQTLNFQVTDQQENTRSLDLPASCITVLNRQSFANLADGSDFGTDPDYISITGKFAEANRGLAAFLYYNEQGLPTPVEALPTALEDWESRLGPAGLAFTNTHHDGEVFTDIEIAPGILPGPGGTFTVDVGITTSVALAAESVTATWYAAEQSGNTKTKGPTICSQTESITASAGDAFAIVVDDCLVDPLSIDAILRVESVSLGIAELFVPQGP